MATRLRRPLPLLAICLALVPAAGPAGPISFVQAAELTLEDRVRAQEAIERVYHSHVLGAARSFEEEVPRALLESRVRAYLRKSLALERIWSTPVTAGMLGREMERMARETRMPGRLRELYATLGDDPVLIQECLARPLLVDRMVRNFYDFDRAVHAESRRRAERLREPDRLRPGAGRGGGG